MYFIYALLSLVLIVVLPVGAIMGYIAFFAANKTNVKISLLEKTIQKLSSTIDQLNQEIKTLKENKDVTKQNEKTETTSQDDSNTISHSPKTETTVQKLLNQKLNNPIQEIKQDETIEQPQTLPENYPTAETPDSSEIKLPPVNAAIHTPQPTPNSDTPTKPELLSEVIEPNVVSQTGKLDNANMDLESKIGAVWFNRIGLVAVVIGFALLSTLFEYQPWHKTAASYAGSLVLITIGHIYSQRLKRFARPVTAGGLGLAFFTSYAAHYIEAMRCIPAELSLILMVVCIGFILGYAEAWKSESTAVLAIFFGHVAAYVGSVNSDSFTVIAIILLCLTSIILCMRHQWITLQMFAVITAYVSHFIWAIQGQHSATPEYAFWINVSFLSSYYLIFLCSDLIFFYQRNKSQEKTYTESVTSHGTGPISLIVYATLVTFFGYKTHVYWNQIHLFYIPLALLQIGIWYYHRSVKNKIHPVYAAASTIFLTLGLFSWIDGLSLNLALAIESLALIILSRWLRFWYLRPLAVSVLVVNFIHFWFMDHSQLDTWPVYFGCVLSAVIYYVQSHMGMFPVKDHANEPPLSTWFKPIHENYKKCEIYIAFVQSIAGSILLLAATYQFFNSPWIATSLALYTLILICAIITFKTSTLVPSIYFLHTVNTVLIMMHNNIVSFLPDWDVSHYAYGFYLASGIVFLSVISSFLAIYMAKKNKDIMLLNLGIVQSVLSFLLIIFHIPPFETSHAFLFLWIISPLALLYSSHFVDGLKTITDWKVSQYKWISYSNAPNVGRYAVLIGIAGGVSLVYSHMALLGVIPNAFIALTMITLIATVVIVVTQQRMLLPSILSIVTLMNLYLIKFSLEQPIGTYISTWWTLTATGLTAALFLFGLLRFKKIVYAMYTLFFILIVQITVIILSSTNKMGFSNYSFWLIYLALLWFILEMIWRAVYKNINAYAVNQPFKTMDEMKNILCTSTLLLSVLSSYVFFVITKQMYEPTIVLWFCIGLLVTVSILSYMLRSLQFLSAIPAAILTIHFGYYQSINTIQHENAFVVLSLVIILVSIACSIVAEIYQNQKQVDLSDKQKSCLLISASIFSILSYVLFAVFFLIQEPKIYDVPSTTFLLEIAFPVSVVLVGWVFRLPIIQLFSIIFILIYILPMLLIFVVLKDSNQSYLLWVCLSVLITFIGVERIVSKQKQVFETMITSIQWEWLKRVLVIAGSCMIILVVSQIEVTRQYWTTLGWSLIALTLMILGFVWNEKLYRRSALVIFFLSLLRIVLIDVPQLEYIYQVVMFLCIGFSMILVSFLYTRFSKRIKDWL